MKDDKGERSKYTPTYEFIDPTVIPTFIPSWESFEESELELEEEIHDLQIKDIERSGLVCLEPSDLLVIPIESVDEINDRLASIFNISIDIGSELTENELKFEA